MNYPFVNGIQPLIIYPNSMSSVSLSYNTLAHRLTAPIAMSLLLLLLTGIPVVGRQAVVSVSAGAEGERIELSRLLGTNLALWYEPEMLAGKTLLEHLRLWSPGLVRLPGGSWSNEYYWNGNGVRTGWDTFNMGSFKEGRWEVDYSGYAPGFRVHGTAQELSDYHGVIDVLTQHKLAESLGAAQMVTVNVGTGTTEMAEQWLKWTRKEGFNVPYWEIGNELNGQWEVGHFLPDGTGMTGEIYAQRFLDYAKALKAVDPSVKVGGPASSDLSLAFVEDLLRVAGDKVDFITFHAYPVGVQRVDTEDKFKDIDLLREALAKLRMWKKQYQPDRYNEIEIGITEWNMKVNEDRDTADLINGLWSAAWIGAMLEGGVTLANQWDLLTQTAEGGHGAFFTDGERLVPKSHFWAHYIWGRHMGDRLIEHSIEEGGHLEVFTTRSETALQVMLINTSETEAGHVRIAVPEGLQLNTEGRLISFSHQEYLWDPHHHRPVWSLPPTVEAFNVEGLAVTVPAFSMRVVELPLAGEQPKALLTVDSPGKPGLKLLIPAKAPADLPLEVWIIACNTESGGPFRGELEAVEITLSGPVGQVTRQIEIDQSVGRFFIKANGPGNVLITARAGELETTGAVVMEAVESRPAVLWTFDNPVTEWGATTTFDIGMEPSVKPNEFVAEAILKDAMPGDNADVLLLLQDISGGVSLDRIGGVIGEMQASPDFSCDDPNAKVNIILQSEANHWMMVGSLPLEAMRGEWAHYRFDFSDPVLLKAMARLYGVRFQIESTAPVTGRVYFDNLGFLLRSAE